jgi:CubicO group peptidase (beta-lactamase class C family)
MIFPSRLSRVRCLAAVLLCWSSTLVAAQEPRPRIEAVDALFADLDATTTPGASVAVIQDGELVHSAGYGCAQLEFGIPIEPSTIFHTASVSKQFTAMAAILLAGEGKLGLDDEVRSHLEWVPDFGTPITVRQLLNHTSGLRDQWEALLVAGMRLDDVITRDQIIGFVKRQRELNFAPGERHLYCNTGYTLLAELVTEVSGQPFKEFTRERIFEPLGMASSHFHDDHEHLVQGRAYSYHEQGDGFAKSVLSYSNVGATSLFSTSEDLVRWLENFEHQRVGGAAAFDAMCQRTVLNDGSRLGYASGVLVGDYWGYETISHSGGDASFGSHVVWFPEKRLGVAVLSNYGGFATGDMALRITNLLLGEPKSESEPVESQVVEEPTKPEPYPITEERLAQCAGSFSAEGGFSMTLKNRGERLYVRLAGRPRQKLKAISETSFTSFFGDVQFEFTPADGEITQVVMIHKGRETRLQRSAEARGLPLDEYAGRYYCPELEATYRLEVEDGKLMVRHLRHGTFELKPSWPDLFTSTVWFFQAEFTRDDAAAIDGFLLQGNRVLNLRFERVASD